MWKCEKCGKEFEKGKSYAVHRTHCLTGREPWNKGKKGLQVAWNKGLPKEESHLYNKSSNAKNYKWTEEQKANLKVLHQSEEYLRNQIESHKGQVAWNKNKKLSEDHVQSLKEAWKCPSQKRLDGIKRRSEKIKGKPSWNKGISPTEETLKKWAKSCGLKPNRKEII